MTVWRFLSEFIEPVTKLIDELSTSDEEKLKIKAELFEMQTTVTNKLLEYETELLEAKKSVINAEADGSGWLQRNWRPVTMLSFLVLVIADTFGLTIFRLVEDAWTLLQIGLGGYLIGRSAEKVIPRVTEVICKK